LEANGTGQRLWRNADDVLELPLQLTARDVAVLRQFRQPKLSFLEVEHLRGRADLLQVDRRGKQFPDEVIFDDGHGGVIVVGTKSRLGPGCQVVPFAPERRRKVVKPVRLIGEEGQGAPREESCR